MMDGMVCSASITLTHCFLKIFMTFEAEKLTQHTARYFHFSNK